MKNNKLMTKRYSRILALNIGITLSSTVAFAAQGPATFFGTAINNMLPSPLPAALPTGFNPVKGMLPATDTVIDKKTGKQKMTVHQNEDTAIASWESFNIGENGWVYFDQQGNTDWKALNRIYDQNPSQIFGKLTADGQVYLINQNGILFGASSSVNVHGLVASALDLDNAAFDYLTKSSAVTFDGGTNYDPENQPGWQPGNGFVYNQGFISVELVGAENGKAKVIRDGSVFLVAPEVANSGTIAAPYGQIGLVAGTRVTLSPETDSTYQNEKYVSAIDNPGQALNEENGILAADNGRVGMYGRVVNQQGMIRSVTSVWHRGAIELRATEKVVTGENSATLAPVTTSEEKTGEDFTHRPGEIYIGGIGRGSGQATGVVEHNGTIAADSGDVRIFATDRAYFSPGSVIDVSGAWSVRDGADQWHNQEMNTAQLKDDQLQKDVNGLLYRSEVTVNELFGSTIGDFSETYATDQLTSLQKASTGGSIRVEVPEGDIIVRDGASFDISGGGHYHGESTGISTKLLFGNRIYDLDDAPSYLPYEAFADSYEKKHERYDITESYSGLYAGGAVPLYDRIPAHVEGHDAGKLTLIGGSLVFDGSLIAHATVGPYQIYDPDLFNDGIIEIDGKQFTERLRRPKSGTLEMGGAATDGDYAEQSNVLGELSIEDKKEPLPEDFTVDSHRDVDAPGSIAAVTINEAGLEALTVKTNRRITVAENADIRLAPGGELHFESRRIEHLGTIDIPSGSVTMQLQHNYTNLPTNPWYAEVSERLILAGASRISTAGERVDQVDALAAGKALATGVQIDGGAISLRDLSRDTIQSFDQGIIPGLGQGDGVILARGALLDVSGGYEITADGKVKGGDAGELLISGSNVVLEGEVRGHSLAGAEGGSLAVFANNIRVEKEVPELYAYFEVNDPLPQLDFGYAGDAGDENEQHFRQFSKGLVLADNRFARTGFSRISLNSIYDFVIGDGVELAVSTTRETAPVAAKTAVEAVSYVEVPAAEAGRTAYTITAGGNLDGVADFNVDYPGQYILAKETARLVLPETSSLKLPVGGTVTLEAPLVTMAGSIEAPAGEITVIAANGNLLVTGTAGISAAGYISPIGHEVIDNLEPVHEVWDAGSITLQNISSTGRLEIAEGAEVDVSGTEETIVGYSDLGTTANPLTGAGKAGSIILSSRGEINVAEGALRGKAYSPGMVNGSLAIERNGGAGYVVDEKLLDIFRLNDFYQWRLAAGNSLIFDHDIKLDHDGTLILDTPLLASTSGAAVTITADWLRLENSYLPTNMAPVSGSGRFALTGDAMGITGAVSFTGVDVLTITSANDMALTDHLYAVSGASGSQYYAGSLRSAADMTLTADRIYPTTFSDFTIATDRTITIKPGTHPTGNLLYSAGGNLTLTANRIDHQGYLAAPLGTIIMSGTGENSRVMLSPGSVTSVAGQPGMVAFGELNDTGEFWTYQRKEDAGTGLTEAVTTAPEKKLTLEGDEVIVRENAQIDLTGGGSIFAYQFLPGLEGTIDPLVKEGQYLVVPGLELPGEVIHLTEGAGNGLAAGTYTLLPLDEDHAENAKYAFLPGAYVLIDQGNYSGNAPAQTLEGYSLVSGYTGMRGHAVDSRVARGFALRSATEVFGEGLYATKELTGGDGGSFELTGRQTTVTAILQGSMQAAALDGYQGGTFAVAAKSIEIGPQSFGLDDDFVIGDPIPDGLQGKLNIKDTTFSGNGFSSVIVGDTAITRSIVLKQDSTISAENVTFNAGSGYLLGEERGGEIIVETGAQVHATQPASGGSGYSEVVFTTDAAFHYDPAEEDEPVSTTLPGGITLAEGSLVHAADNITLDTDNLDLQGTGNLQVDHSTLTLKGSRIVFSAAGRATGESGLFLTDSQWRRFANIEEIRLDSATDILFAGDFSLSGMEELVFDAQRIGGYEADDFAAVSIAAPRITLANSKTTYAASLNRRWLPGVTSLAMAGSGAGNFLTLQGTEGITLGPGDIRVDGFREVNLRTSGDLALTGQAYQGKDERGNDIFDPSAFRAQADINISAARLTLDPMDNGAYKAADYLLSAIDAVRIMPAAGGVLGGPVGRGGRLRIEGTAIDHQGMIDTSGATIILGADEVNVGGTVRSTGSDETAAGSVTIKAQNSFTLEEDGVLDVSAGSQGDAGELAISAPFADFTLAGSLLGAARDNGMAGSFTIDVRDLSGANGSTGFDALTELLSAGGFSQSIDVRSREGNITLGADKTVTAEYFKLTADGNAVTGHPENPTGNIDIYGTVNGSGDDGGEIGIYAANDLTLRNGARLLATATAAGGQGGEVFLSAAAKSGAQSPLGYIRLSDNGVIDVSGGPGGHGGSVSFRAQRNAEGNDVKMDLAGKVIGADSITAEGVRLYTYGQITTAEQNTMKTDAVNYAAKVKPFSSPGVKGVFDTLATENVAADAFHHRAGIEVRSSGDLTVKNAWNLTNWLGAGAEPVNLTLRAAGNLNINENIYDKPTSSTVRLGLKVIGNLAEEVIRPSADLNLVAGARTDSADFMAVIKDLAAPDTTGRLVVADTKKIYTETGNIRFASASDTLLGKAALVNPAYDPSPWKEGNLASTLASFRGNVQGYAGRDLVVKGAIQTATGDIDIRTGRDILFSDPQDPNRNLIGSIRTTGVPASYEVDYANTAGAGMLRFYNYSQGGSIAVTSGGDIKGGVTTLGNNWDAWWRSAGKWSAAFAQTSGGTLGIATMAGGDVRVSAAGDIDTQMGTFGQGDLAVRSGSDLNGRFLAADGRGDLYAQGSFGASRPDQQLELMDAALSLVAEGDIFLGTVLNPSYVRSKLNITLDEPGIYMGYTPGSSVSLKSVQGDVAITGHSDYETANGNAKSLVTILPARLAIEAGQDIILSMAELILSPAADGNLHLAAGHDIRGTSYTTAGYPQPASIRMLQSDPDDWYGLQTTDLGTDAPDLPLHTADPLPVTVAAGRNIENVRIESPKRTEVTAGNDIRDLELRAQNIDATDISFVRSGGDIVMGSYERIGGNIFYSGFRFAGPGDGLVQAGGSISLGTTEGIRSVANGPEAAATAWDDGVHPSLSFNGADLYVLSGIAGDLAPGEVKGFFDAIRAANKEISLLLAEGDKAKEAQEIEDRVRQELILPLFGTLYPETVASAGISMTQSKIATLYGGDVNILSAGDLDVGGTSFTQRNSSSGIKTEFGGGINIFSVGAVNVNESRAMSWMGGDITIWTENDLNAGRGSTTAVNASGDAVSRINEESIAELFKKPSVGGSGIRAITYDPDGPNGPRQTPEAGDIYLFAKGTIDAGEAGINGGNIYLVAAKVVNAQNISFSQSGVGVPVQRGSGVNIGALSGAGAIMTATMASPSAAGIGETQKNALQETSDLSETLVPKVLKVEVIDLQEKL
ncbi:MAG: filamentous hemagglutinin family protein [Desulfobulbaceae bacterium]|nr:filamentous hemagglutinin family protein [Desulfobulbaceae bacterium]